MSITLHTALMQTHQHFHEVELIYLSKFQMMSILLNHFQHIPQMHFHALASILLYQQAILSDHLHFHHDQIVWPETSKSITFDVKWREVIKFSQ